MIKTIGIDPGLAATGVGIVWGSAQQIEGFSYGSIRTSKNTDLPGRLYIIFSKLHQLIQREAPDLMVVEDVFSLERYPRSGIILGKVAGVILLAGVRQQILIREIPVREAKQALTGNGNADKAQLERAVRRTLNHGQRIKPDHASDALGLALIGLLRYGRFVKAASSCSERRLLQEQR